MPILLFINYNKLIVATAKGFSISIFPPKYKEYLPCTSIFVTVLLACWVLILNSESEFIISWKNAGILSHACLINLQQFEKSSTDTSKISRRQCRTKASYRQQPFWHVPGHPLWADMLNVFSVLMPLLQLPALRPSCVSTPPANPTTSRCRGSPRRARWPTWPWRRTKRGGGGPVTPAAPPARYQACSVDSSTGSMLLELMPRATEPWVTFKWFAQVGV